MNCKIKKVILIMILTKQILYPVNLLFIIMIKFKSLFECPFWPSIYSIKLTFYGTVQPLYRTGNRLVLVCLCHRMSNLSPNQRPYGFLHKI